MQLFHYSLWTFLFTFVNAQNFQWSSESGSRPWPFGGGGDRPPPSQSQQQPGQVGFQAQPPQLQAQWQPPSQSRQPWQIIPDQGRPSITSSQQPGQISGPAGSMGGGQSVSGSAGSFSASGSGSISGPSGSSISASGGTSISGPSGSMSGGGLLSGGSSMNNVGPPPWTSPGNQAGSSSWQSGSSISGPGQSASGHRYQPPWSQSNGQIPTLQQNGLPLPGQIPPSIEGHPGPQRQSQAGGPSIQGQSGPTWPSQSGGPSIQGQSGQSWPSQSGAPWPSQSGGPITQGQQPWQQSGSIAGSGSSPSWFGDPNRPPDAQIWPNQPVGPSIHTTADKTVIMAAGPWNVPQPAGLANQQPSWSGSQPSQAGPQWQSGPAGAFNPSQSQQSPWQQQQFNGPPPAGWNPYQSQQGQQREQLPPGVPPPLWVPWQQGWITNPPLIQPTTSPSTASTTPAIDDNTVEILRDLVAYHVGGTFPRDEVRQYNAKVPMPRQHRDYWLGEIYYNLDPASQLPGKLKCVYSLPQAMNRLHYDDGTPVGVVVFQCVQFQEKCCNLDCCNLNAKPQPPQQQQPWRYPYSGVSSNYLSWSILITLLLLLHLRSLL